MTGGPNSNASAGGGPPAVPDRRRGRGVLTLIALLGVCALVAVVVVLRGWFTTSPGSSAPAAASGGGSAAAAAFEMTAEETVQIIKAYQAMLANADRAGVDVAARAATLPGTAETFAFVRDEVANDVYPGVLRGPEGTLSAGAGNDADKALLLARLLAAQKRTARFAQCELPEDKAGARVRSMIPRSQRKPSGDLDAMLSGELVRQGMTAGRAAQVVEARKASAQGLDAAVAAAAQADLATVREALRAANIVPAPAFDRAALVAEARAHIWVQVEEDGRWQDLDPAFPKAQQGTAFCEAAQTMGELPPEAYQTVTVVVRNEYLKDETTETTTTLEHAFRTADLHARATLFVNVPLPLEEVAGKGEAAVQGFIPALITDDGVVIGKPFPLESAGPEKKPVDAGSLFGALGGGEEVKAPGAAGRLVGQRLEFVIEAPGRKTVVSRAIFDGVAPDERVTPPISTRPDTVQLVRRLAAPYAIAVSTGRVDPLQLLPGYARIDSAALGRVLSGLGGGNVTDEVLNDFVVLQPHMLAVRALNLAAQLDGALSGTWRDGYRHAIAFRDQPLIVIADSGTGGSDAEAGLSFDLRHDEIRVVSDESGKADEVFWLNVHRGLVDGALERAALPSPSVLAGHQDWARESRARVVSMSAVSELARSSGIGFRAAAGANAVQALRSFGAPGGFRLADEVRENTAAIMPVKPVLVAGGNRMGIWALSLGSGHVIPLLDTGLRHAWLAPTEAMGGPDAQPGAEYETTRKTRELDLWWRTSNHGMQQVERLLLKNNCYGGGGGVACKMLMEAWKSFFRSARMVRQMYLSLGEQLPFVPPIP